jgi:hypothetical protein
MVMTALIPQWQAAAAAAFAFGGGALLGWEICRRRYAPRIAALVKLVRRMTLVADVHHLALTKEQRKAEPFQAEPSPEAKLAPEQSSFGDVKVATLMDAFRHQTR